MRKLIVGDTHLGLYSDSELWLGITLDFFKYIVRYCIENDIKQLYHLGDFFDNRKSLNTKTQHIAHKIAKILALKSDLEVYIIVGNHDCYYKNTIQPNTLELFKEYNHIHIIDEITQVDDILLVPWGKVPDSQSTAKYCFGHFAINDFYMNDSIQCKDGLDSLKFKDFDKVLSGHFHTPTSSKNIVYLGAPYGQTFNDVNGVRGFHIFEDGNLDFIQYNNAPTFKKIHTTSDPLNPEDITGNIVRVVFTQDFGTTHNQNIIDNILEHKPLLYSVDFTNINTDDGVEITGESVEMESKEQIVDQFINNQTFASNINIVTLKSMFKKLLRELGDAKSIKTTTGARIECISVGFQNFLSFGSRWQDMELYNGINFVTGLDKDKGKSNGAGKSSFLETIPFALFGKTARDITQTQIINWKNKKNCRVVFRFKINDILYEIDRQLRPNKLEIYKNGVSIDQDAHKSDYQSMFEDIFGMDVKMFMNLIHSNINNSGSILSMKKAEKRTFLEKMFGLEIYSNMNKLANDKLRVVEEKKYKFETDIKSYRDKIESSENLKRKLTTEIQGKKASVENVSEVREKLNRLKESNPNIDNEITDVENLIEEERAKIGEADKNYEKVIAVLSTRLESIEKQISEIDKQEEQRKKNESLKTDIDNITTKQGDFNDITKKVQEVSLKREVVKSYIDGLSDKKFELNSSLVEYKTDLRNVQKNLDLLADGKCPTCGQDVENPITHYREEKDYLLKKISLIESELFAANKAFSDLQKDDSQLIRKIEILEKFKNKLVNLESQIKDVGNEEDKEEMLRTYSLIGQEKMDKDELYKRERRSLTSTLEALRNKYTDLIDIRNSIAIVQKEYDIVVSRAEEIANTVKSLYLLIKEQDEAIEKAEDDEKKSVSGIEKLNDLSDYLNAIKFILKDENIKQFTIKQIMPFLNKQTNHYLSEVNYGFYVSIDKWLDVAIKGPGIRNATYDSLSGGERRGIDLSLQLALLDIARIQVGIFPDILVFDELLDSSIDGVGIDQIMRIIKAKHREFGGKIFIISHRGEIDAELIDNQYHVEKENGYSKVII